jgi:hypothetical protein
MWARGYGLCQDGIFRRYLSGLSKRPAFVKAFAGENGPTIIENLRHEVAWRVVPTIAEGTARVTGRI